MPRPGWQDEYWDRLDEDTQRKMRTICPRCGSSKTYFNERFQTWRCGRCEHSFVIQGLDDKTSWWKRFFKFKK